MAAGRASQLVPAAGQWVLLCFAVYACGDVDRGDVVVDIGGGPAPEPGRWSLVVSVLPRGRGDILTLKEGGRAVMVLAAGDGGCYGACAGDGGGCTLADCGPQAAVKPLTTQTVAVVASPPGFLDVIVDGVLSSSGSVTGADPDEERERGFSPRGVAREVVLHAEAGATVHWATLFGEVLTPALMRAGRHLRWEALARHTALSAPSAWDGLVRPLRHYPGTRRALSFDGKATRAIAQDWPLGTEATGFTAELWFRAAPSAEPIQALLSSVDPDSPGSHLLQLFREGFGDLTLLLAPPDGGPASYSGLDSVATHNGRGQPWSHIALSVGSGDTFLSVDGRIIGALADEFAHAVFPERTRMCVGCGLGYGRLFAGMMAEVRLWTGPRSLPDIRACMQGLAHPGCDGGGGGAVVLRHWPLSDNVPGHEATAANPSGEAPGTPLLLIRPEWKDEDGGYRPGAQARDARSHSEARHWHDAAAARTRARDIVVLDWDSLSSYAPWDNAMSCPSCTVVRGREWLPVADVVAFEVVVYNAGVSAPALPEKLPGQLWAVTHFENAAYETRTLANPAFMSLFDVHMYADPAATLPISLMCGEDNPDVSVYFRDPPQKDPAKVVAWFGSNCGSRHAVARREYIQELMDHIRVDSYGTCLHTADIEPGTVPRGLNGWEQKIHVLRGYMFGLAFENHEHPYYVTEKIAHVFQAGAVPIYMGTADVSEFVPRADSYIDVRDFAGPADLARHISEVSRDPERYQAYFAWKKDPASVSPSFYEWHDRCVYKSLCRLCDYAAGAIPLVPPARRPISLRAVQIPGRGAAVVVRGYRLGDDGRDDHLTVSLWVRPRASSPAERAVMRDVLRFGPEELGIYGAVLGLAGRRDSVAAAWCQGGRCFRATQTILVGAWHHIALVTGGGRARFYVNGECAGSYKVPPLGPAAAEGLTMGGGGFAGDLDSVGVWDGALDRAQVRLAAVEAPHRAHSREPYGRDSGRVVLRSLWSFDEENWEGDEAGMPCARDSVRPSESSAACLHGGARLVQSRVKQLHSMGHRMTNRPAMTAVSDLVLPVGAADSKDEPGCD